MSRILVLIWPSFAAASAGTSEAQALITGEESHASKFERGVQTLLADGGWAGTTWRVDAAFGVFGSLPLVGVTAGKIKSVPQLSGWLGDRLFEGR